MSVRHADIPTVLAAFFALAASGFGAAAQADDTMRSSPPDQNSYYRPLIPDDLDPPTSSSGSSGAKRPQFDVFVVDAVVNNTDPDLKNIDTFDDGEVSIAINPERQSEIIMTAFSGSWGLRAPLWRSSNRGNTWTKEFTVNPPPGVGVIGCPCDQTVDFTELKYLAGAFLTESPANIYAALNRNPAALTFHYFESPPGVAQPINHLNGVNNEDQPWLLVGPQPGASGENVYVAYDDSTPHPTCMSLSQRRPIRSCLPLITAADLAPEVSIPDIALLSIRAPARCTAFSSGA